MADNEKKHADWLDIPDGNGGTERTYFRDAEARADIDDLKGVSAMTASQVEGIWNEVFNPSNNS